jgi:hypothetical protein
MWLEPLPDQMGLSNVVYMLEFHPFILGMKSLHEQYNNTVGCEVSAIQKRINKSGRNCELFRYIDKKISQGWPEQCNKFGKFGKIDFKYVSI